jgi:hypothetical protein
MELWGDRKENRAENFRIAAIKKKLEGLEVD